MSLAKYLLLLSMCLPACATSGPTTERYSLQFDAIDDRGDPIEGLVVVVGETRIGATGSAGTLQAEVNASKGERFALHLSCPENYQLGESPKHIVFRETKGLAGKSHSRMHVMLECSRQERVAALLVHTEGYADMPVLVDGVQQGRTGADGFAHLRVDLPPGTPFEVAIDSSQHAKLRPVNPRRTMTLGSEDGLFIFAPVFSEVAPVKKKRRKRIRKRGVEKPIVKRPLRID